MYCYSDKVVNGSVHWKINILGKTHKTRTFGFHLLICYLKMNRIVKFAVASTSVIPKILFEKQSTFFFLMLQHFLPSKEKDIVVTIQQ